MYSPWGASDSYSEIGSMGQQGNLGFYKGTSNRFFTHLLDCTVVVVIVTVSVVSADDDIDVIGEVCKVRVLDVKAVLCVIHV